MARVHLDRTAASGYCPVMDDGLFPCGYRNDHRPDLPQVAVSFGQAPVAAAVRQRGWQVAVSTQLPEQLSLQEAVLAYVVRIWSSGRWAA